MLQTDKETLSSRVVDRVIRPLFPEGYFNETQVNFVLRFHPHPLS
jgi:polyribonucleotide nucleotidyltransferase